MKTMFSLFINIKNIAVADRSRFAKRILSYCAISIVILSATQSVWSLAAYFSQRDTNTYTIRIAENVSLKDIQDAVKQFLQLSGEKCAVNLYSKYSDEFNGYIIGANEFLHAIWSAHIHNDDLIKSDEAYIWMGSDYWSSYESLDFPLKTISINNKQYVVAGSCNTAIVFNESSSEYIGYSDISSSSMIMPLKTYLADHIPIRGIVLFYDQPPSDREYTRINSSFQVVSADSVVKKPTFILSGLASPVALVCAISILGGFVFMGIETYMTTRQARMRQKAMRICGGSNAQLIWDEMSAHIVLAILAFILAVFPAQVVHFIDPYAYDLALVNYMVIWSAYSVIMFITLSLSITVAVRKNCQQ